MTESSVTLYDGSCSPVSPTRRARVRFNFSNWRWEMSIDGSAYFSMCTPTSYWQLRVLLLQGWTHHDSRASFIEVTEDQAEYLYDAGWRFTDPQYQQRWVCDGPPRPFRGKSSSGKETP